MILYLCLLWLAAEPAPEVITKLIERGEQRREQLLKTLPVRIAETKADIGLMKRARIGDRNGRIISGKQKRYEFTNAQARRDAIVRAQERVTELTAQLEAAKSGQFIRPEIDAFEVSAGDIGELRYPFYCTAAGSNSFPVFQVLDERNVLIKTGKSIRWVSEISTAGLVDGGEVKLDGILYVAGTKTYKSAVGTNTVFVLTPVDMAVVAKYLPKPKKEVEPKSSGERTTREFRTWTDITGKHTIEAVFSGLISGKVVLVTRDNRKLTMDPQQLSQADQDWIANRTKR